MCYNFPKIAALPRTKEYRKLHEYRALYLLANERVGAKRMPTDRYGNKYRPKN